MGDLHQSIKVILADDHPIVLEGIRNMLEKTSEINILGETCHSEDVLSLVENLGPDVLLLDMEMPGKKGHEIIQEIRERQLPVRILALSAHNNRHYIKEAISNGASGYLLKDEAPTMIIEAVQGVAHGEEGWVSHQVAAQLTAFLDEEEPDDFNLTPRERTILQGLSAGKTNKEIAVDLCMSEKTVEKELQSIYPKLGVNSRVEAAVLKVRQELEERD